MPEYLPALITFIVGILLMICCSILSPSIHFKFGKIDFTMDSFWIGPFIAAIVVLGAQIIPFITAMEGLWSFSTLNPIGILILFFSMVYISKFLDTTGFFQLCASWALRKSGKSGKKLFFIIYAIVSVLTIFTSNDVVILTFTPFIHYFSQAAGVSSKPFLFGEFFAANTWSMIFIISNPTNVVLGTGFGQDFGKFVKYMVLPTFAGGLSNLLVLYLLFRKQINQEFEIDEEDLGDPMEHVQSKLDLFVGIFFMLGSIIIMACSSIPGFNVEMWQIAGIMAVVLLIYNIVIDIKNRHLEGPSKLRRIFSTLPYAIIPFLVALFILVNALSIKGLFTAIGGGIGKVTNKSEQVAVAIFGVLSTFAANILNNIPMSVAFVPILQETKNPPSLGSVYATVVGANLGANLTPLGALAGLMWLGILKQEKINIGFKEFIKIGFIVTPVCLVVTLAFLMCLV
ncbi:anion permease arsB family [Histomonas meleagridis]|uniref:anion permease arsB family n=1 Tax=Histomonas meleagridis TaxID=135588 RepID=UPI003559A364|nr:anion permease arsB family [Histomonas meleagridis]KAH0796601.1 anion permease arsB family [Histomonas meleagridis]